MITGVHAIVFSEHAAAVRSFFSDTLGLDWVDAGGSWPIYALPPAELAVHPGAAQHQLYLMCDDMHATICALEAKGVTFSEPVSEQSWGLVTVLTLPGGESLSLYEPRHPRPAAS